MAGFIDNTIQAVKRGIHSLVGHETEIKNDEHVDITVKSSKRAASPAEHSPQQQPRQKRRRGHISPEEERLLLPHSVVPTPGSVEIPIPVDTWNMSSKRKVAPGAFAPRNTLHKSFAPTRSYQLPTTTTSGHNVPSSPPNKRRRIDGEDAPVPDEWFNREQRDSPSRPRKLSRQESIVSVPSQDHSSQDQRFRQSEFEQVSRIIGPQKQKRRKPKPSSAASSQVDIQEGTSTAPVAVDDDDDDTPKITKVTQSARRPTTQRLPRAAVQSSPIRAPSGQTVSIEVNSDSLARLQEQSGTQKQKNKAPQDLPLRPMSPPLRQKFVRTNDPPPPSKRREKMRATSITARPAKIESSDDELASSNNVVSSSTRTEKTRRPLPESEIKSSHFSNTTSKKSPGKSNAYVPVRKDGPKAPTAIPLKSILTQAVQLESDTLMLLSAPQVNFFAIHNIGFPVLHDGKEIRFIAKHMQHVTKSSGDSNAMYVTGAMDTVTGAKIWLDFKTRGDRDDCFDAIRRITRDNVKKTDVEDARLQALHNHAVEIFSTKKTTAVDPEIQAMLNRQSAAANKGLSARARTMTSQQGANVPEPEIQITPSRLTRKSAMKADYANPSSSVTIKGTSPQPEIRTEPSAPTRTSRRISKKEVEQIDPPEPTFDQWTKTHGVPSWESPLVYPANGAKQTTVNAIDLERLDDGEFLNDNIISFYLRYLQENNPHVKDQVYIFNTFFYTALSTNRQGKRTLNYDAVKRWTKNIDLFKYPIVVVPVNVSLHWFLIIICNLDKLEQTLNGQDEKLEEEKATTPPRSLNEEIPESPQNPKDEVLSQRVGRLSLDATEQKATEPSTGKLQSASRKAEKKPSRIDLDTPSIITLDSLGASHTAEVRHLKEYVALEGADKRGLDFEYSALRGVVAKGIPHQTNFYDCGVYLVGYMVELLKDPTGFVGKVLSRELDRDNDFAGFDPTEKRVEIRELLLKLADEQKEAKKAKRRAKKNAQQAKSSEEPKSRGETPATRSPPIKSPSRFSDPGPVDEEDEMLMDNEAHLASPDPDASAKPQFGSSTFGQFAGELQSFAGLMRD